MRDKTKEYTFGYFRAEVITTMFSIIIFFTLTLWLVFFGYKRIATEQVIDTKVMLISASVGLFFNLYNNKLMLERGTSYSRKL
jgi:Co/Zn/Cd efflux system component